MKDLENNFQMINSEFNLAPPRSLKEQYFVGQHRVNQHAVGGKLLNAHSYELDITCKPGNQDLGKPDTYTCSRFVFKPYTKSKVTIPSLENWYYSFDPSSFENDGLDSDGIMWGLPHEMFEGMKDSSGKEISIDPQYQVYSAFTYFHSFCGSNIVSNEASRLKKIGDRTTIEMPPSSPVNLGSMFLSNSKYDHGETIMEFSGLSAVDEKTCAVFRMWEIGGGYMMYIRPMPTLSVKTIGSTRIVATMFLDLETGWIRKAEATITDITKTTMYGIPVETSSIITDLQIQALSQDAFEKRIMHY